MITGVTSAFCCRCCSFVFALIYFLCSIFLSQVLSFFLFSFVLYIFFLDLVICFLILFFFGYFSEPVNLFWLILPIFSFVYRFLYFFLFGLVEDVALVVVVVVLFWDCFCVRIRII